MLTNLVKSPFYRFAFTLPIAVVLIFSAMAYPIYQQLIAALEREVRASIRTEITTMEARYQSSNESAIQVLINNAIARSTDGRDIYFFAESDNRKIAGNLDQWPLLDDSDDQWHHFTLADGGDVIANVLVLFDQRKLLIGRRSAESKIANSIRQRMVVGAVLSFIAVMGAAWFLTRRLRRRLSTLGMQAELIRAGDLKERLVVSQRDDEIDALTKTLNRMLEQIETLVQSSRHASSAIAHDMRTPLTRMRQRIEAFLSQSLLHPQVREEIECIDNDLQYSLDLFAAILRLARLQAGTFGPRKEVLSLSELVQDVCDLYEPVAENRNAKLVCQTVPCSVKGDRDLLFQAVANLIENALRYARSKIAVRIEILNSGMISVRVHDDGPGFPAKIAEHIFEPFVRGDASRTTTGSGLGLALVRAILRVHDGGDAQMVQNVRGACIELTLNQASKK